MKKPPRPRDLDRLPDVRDGLTRVDRAILVALARLQAERGPRSTSTAMLYGRVVEIVDVGEQEFMQALQWLLNAARRGGQAR